MPTYSGFVKDINDDGVPRTLRFYQRDTGALLGSTDTNAATGAFSFTTVFTGEVQVIMLDDLAGSVENDQILRVVPL